MLSKEKEERADDISAFTALKRLREELVLPPGEGSAATSVGSTSLAQ